MSYLTANRVVMGATAKSKDEALLLVGKALGAHGLTEPGYEEALYLREAQASTYLGSGLAIPHGTPEYKARVLNTGVVLVHFADGVDWGDGNMVYVAVGIAAKSDEHLGVLRALTRALGEDIGEALKNARTAHEIIVLLEGGAKEEKEQAKQTLDQSATLRILNRQVDVTDFEGLLIKAAQDLKAKGVAADGFARMLLGKTPLQLAPAVWLVQEQAEQVLSSAVALFVPKSPLSYQSGQVSVLMVLAGVPADEQEALIEALLELPIHKDMPQDKLLALLGRALGVSESAFEMENYHQGEVVVANRHGLHARPATALAKLAGDFAGSVLVSSGSDWVSAKSLTRLLSLGVGYGQRLKFRVEALDGGKVALQSLIDAVQAGLGETVEVQTKPNVSPPLDDEKIAIKAGVEYHGIIASKGLAVAQGFVARTPTFEYEKYADSSIPQKEALDIAIMRAKADLVRSISLAKNAQIAGIFSAHHAILEDSEIIDAVHARIDTGLSAPYSWHEEIEALAGVQANLDNPLLAERAADLKDVGRRVLALLCNGTALSAPSEPYVLIKEDLLPSDVAGLDANVVAILTAVGGANSHGAIIARSLGLPAIVGAGAAILDIAEGERVLVDALKGVFMVAPSEALVSGMMARQALHQKALAEAHLHAHEPAVSLDGRTLQVMANLGDVADGDTAVQKGAEGVGLLRTEFVFMKHNQMPDEETQIADYTQIFDAMDGKPVVVRTLDVGGDKPLPYLTMKKEENPFLGVRGIRLSLQRPELLECQLISLIKASNNRPLAIMFPMVGQLNEWYKAKSILDKVLKTHPHDNLQVGIMVEVPSTAILADKFAPEVDFFSIGTNDLTQYALAIDRGHPMLSASADGLDPSVLRLIDMTIKAAHAHGKWVGVCGELGSDSSAVPVLLGLGVDELSVSAGQIPLVKAQIRKLSFMECQTLAKTALGLDSGQAVRALVEAQVGQ